MKLIAPSEISGKIMTLIENAKKEIIIVSPYNNLSNWIKLQNRIKRAIDKGINIKWYTRGNNVDKRNADEVRVLGIEPVLVDN